MGKWKAQDDFQLIQSVIQLNNLSDVLKLTKFTRKFSLKELRDRWNAILYDAPIAKWLEIFLFLIPRTYENIENSFVKLSAINQNLYSYQFWILKIINPHVITQNLLV